jgi:hypothetical protein
MPLLHEQHATNTVISLSSILLIISLLSSPLPTPPCSPHCIMFFSSLYITFAYFCLIHKQLSHYVSK